MRYHILGSILALIISGSKEVFSINPIKITPTGLNLFRSFFSSSLTKGYGLSPQQSFPRKVQSILEQVKPYKINISVDGITGTTSASAVSRLKNHIKTTPKTDILVLALGANDAYLGLNIASMRKNLSMTIQLAQKQNIKVLLCGINSHSNLPQKKSTEFHQVFIDLAEQYKILLMPFLLKNVRGKKALNQADRSHPNAQGYTIVAKNVSRYLLRMLP